MTLHEVSSNPARRRRRLGRHEYRLREAARFASLLADVPDDGQNNRLAYVYGLEDPRDGLIRYIGLSIRPKQRLTQHIQTARGVSKDGVARWLSDGGKTATHAPADQPGNWLGPFSE